MDLSIIIPVYNGAATIGRCLDSIYSQGLDEKEFEVICVDDCSPDPSSVAAIENYKYKNCTPFNLVLIKHEVNKRMGGARNTGVRSAKGEWIQFVDCDDYLLPNSLKQLQDIALSYPDLDLIHFCYLTGTETQVLERSNEGRQASQIMTGSEYHIKLPGPSKATEALFRKSCFYTNNLWFEENVRFEDVDFATKFNILARKVIFVPIEAYYYIKHQGQTTDIKAEIDVIRELFLLPNRMVHIAKEFMGTSDYYNNGSILMHHAALSCLLYTKRDLWKIGFKDRIAVLRETRLTFYTGYKSADFIYHHPIITSLLLIPMNQILLNILIKGKKIKKHILNRQSTRCFCL